MHSVEQHTRRFERLIGLSSSLLIEGYFEGAAQVAQLAASYAWHRHTGFYSSPALEEILAAVATARIGGNCGTRSAPAGNVNRVLHVLTAAYGVGGHTRFAARWMELDSTRSHSVALTRQTTSPVPNDLKAAVASRHGEIHRLDATTATLIDRADALRALAPQFDVVVLHIHPDDAAPVLAFDHRDGSPLVLFINHADHVFWLGVNSADVYINFRETGQSLARRRRGLSDSQMTILPIPIASPEPEMTREEARRALGLGDHVLILTIGASYKYQPLAGKGFLDYVAPILATHPEAVLLAIGPDPVGRWREEERRSGGQIRALGTRSDLPNLFAAADVYIDSFPFGSVTATLEAGAHGLPVLEFRSLPAGSEILGSDSPGLAPMIVTRRESDLAAELTRLIGDQGLRNRIGQELKAAIHGAHSDGGWKATLEEIYGRAPWRSPAQRPVVTVEELDRLTAELQSLVVPKAGLAGQAKFLAKRTPGFWFLQHVRALPSGKERAALLRLMPLILRNNFG